MESKILVTYSTCKNTHRNGENADTIAMKDVKDLSEHKYVIAGSAIKAGKWFPDAIEFIKLNKDELNAKPFAAFLVCMTLAMSEGESYRNHVNSWMEPVRQLVKPVHEGFRANQIPSK